MANNSGRVVLRLSNDRRLVAGVAAAVGHTAARVGCDARTQADLVAAAEDACHAALPLLTAAGSQLGVIIEEFSDRVEITLEHPSLASSEAVSRTPFVPGVGGTARVDRVEHATRGGTSRVTLIKYVRREAGQK